MKSVLLVLLLSFAHLFAACSDSTRPEPEPVPTVELTLSWEPVFQGGHELIRVWATFENVTLDSVSCVPSCGDSYWFNVFNELGEWVRVEDPAWGHLCPRERPVLLPGELIEYPVDVGLAWTDTGEQYVLPDGEYTVEVEVRYYPTVSGSSRRAEAATLIEWSDR